MKENPIQKLVDGETGQKAVLQGNVAFAVGCVRGGIHLADGYPGTPSTEVIDKALRHVQEWIRVGWSVNEANATALAFGATMVGADAVVTMKVPGLFQAADAVATISSYTADRGGLVLYIASDFIPTSTQHPFDPRYFLKSCFIPVIEPRNHQEMLEAGPQAAQIARRFSTPVAVLVNGLMCHSEGLVRLNPHTKLPFYLSEEGFKRFMNLPSIARKNYDEIVTQRAAGLRRFAEDTTLNRIDWRDKNLGVVVHGMSELYLKEVLSTHPLKPSVLSLGMTYPVPVETIRQFAQQIDGPILVFGDGLRFIQEELMYLGIPAQGKPLESTITEWTPEALAEKLGITRAKDDQPSTVSPIPRPPTICPGCSYRGFGLIVKKLRKKKKIVASFGDIGCNTLLYFLEAIDTCTCMGAADSKRQGAVIADPSLADKTISVIGDSTECHSGLDSTRNAIFRRIPGVKVVLDNRITAMTGGQPAPSSEQNLAGHKMRFDLVEALKGEGAKVEVVDAFDMKSVERTLKKALVEAADGEYSVIVIRGPCMQQLPASQKRVRFQVDHDTCEGCDLCLVCPGLEKDADGYPRFTHLCNGCGGKDAICVQLCNRNAIQPLEKAFESAPPDRVQTPPVEQIALGTLNELPSSIRLAVRGVGGQGNLFLGKVLAELALLLGYQNIIKGETHGMAQLGGAVLSTFASGDVHSPVFSPESVDTLVVLERSEVLRPGFLALLKPGGTVVLNTMRILPFGLSDKDYPTLQQILDSLKGHNVVQFDGLEQARSLGALHGKAINVIALGVLSRVHPFTSIPLGYWQKALYNVSHTEQIKKANWEAFVKGRELIAL